MKRLLPLVLMAPFLIGADEGPPVPAPGAPNRCSLYSIEGLRPGMTLADVEAAGIDARVRRYLLMPPAERGKRFRFKGQKNDGEFTLSADGSIKTITLSFPTIGLDGRTQIEFDALVKILTERWGAPKANDTTERALHNAFNAIIGQATLRQATWSDRECDIIATAEGWTIQRHFGFAGAGSSVSFTLGRGISLDDLDREDADKERQEKEAREAIRF